MNGPFKIGQICIWQNVASPYAHFNGQECEIIGSLEPRLIHRHTGAFDTLNAYKILFNGNVMAAGPEQLRPKRPPTVFIGEQRIRELFTPAPTKELEPA